ncbi:Carboxylesterase SOBER1 [Zea mays]|uniref:Carboxylesterase SOBER1 n=1 Tax=Zea mays TaxID=4577 RepID=A0A1D6DU55_MAIZE|nr:Carboxylesterase SOBER1 [Zea mays]
MSSLIRLLFTLAAAIGAASLLVASLRRRAPPPGLPAKLVPSSHMAGRNRSFVLWLHGLGDSGPANEPIRNLFSAPEFRLAKWSFPSAPRAPVSCNSELPPPYTLLNPCMYNCFKSTFADKESLSPRTDGFVMPSWFDIHELPMSAGSPQDETGVLKAVEKVHAMIDREVADGIHPENIFVCGFSQGGALTLASVLLYPKKLGGGAVFSGWVPFSSSVTERISPEARKAYPDLGHSLSQEELLYLESWIKSRLNASQEKDG